MFQSTRYDVLAASVMNVMDKCSISVALINRGREKERESSPCRLRHCAGQGLLGSSFLELHFVWFLILDGVWNDMNNSSVVLLSWQISGL
jgi:hypothetical protein